MVDKHRLPEKQTPDSIIGSELARDVPVRSLIDIGYDVARILGDIEDDDPEQEDANTPDEEINTDLGVVGQEDEAEKAKNERHPSTGPHNLKKVSKPPKRVRPELQPFSFSEPVGPEPGMDEYYEEPLDDQDEPLTPGDYISSQLASEKQKTLGKPHIPELREKLKAIKKPKPKGIQ